MSPNRISGVRPGTIWVIQSFWLTLARHAYQCCASLVTATGRDGRYPFATLDRSVAGSAGIRGHGHLRLLFRSPVVTSSLRIDFSASESRGNSWLSVLGMRKRVTLVRYMSATNTHGACLLSQSPPLDMGPRTSLLQDLWLTGLARSSRAFGRVEPYVIRKSITERMTRKNECGLLNSGTGPEVKSRTFSR